MEKPDYHLLIVDDAKFYRETLVLGLRKYFSVIDLAGNLESAVSLLQNRNYDVVITDGVFPKVGDYEVREVNNDTLNGIKVARMAKKKGIYVIGISSELRLLGNVSDATFKKPFSISDLQIIIKKHLGIN
jgi:DNA-binding response OmpR family regulator